MNQPLTEEQLRIEAAALATIREQQRFDAEDERQAGREQLVIWLLWIPLVVVALFLIFSSTMSGRDKAIAASVLMTCTLGIARWMTRR